MHIEKKKSARLHRTHSDEIADELQQLGGKERQERLRFDPHLAQLRLTLLLGTTRDEIKLSPVKCQWCGTYFIDLSACSWPILLSSEMMKGQSKHPNSTPDVEISYHGFNQKIYPIRISLSQSKEFPLPGKNRGKEWLNTFRFHVHVKSPSGPIASVHRGEPRRVPVLRTPGCWRPSVGQQMCRQKASQLKPIPRIGAIGLPKTSISLFVF